MTAKRLALGTVQFGLAYGITNSEGQVPPLEVRAILAAAARSGLDTLDTAAAYGESERVLGAEPLSAGFRVVTKLPPAGTDTIGQEVIARLDAAIVRSMRHLGRDRLDALLLHKPADLFLPGGGRILALLREKQAAGLVGRIGVSVYDPPELERILGLFTPELVQLPANVLDQRFHRSGLVAALKGAGCEIHARSAFLQGSLLVERPPAPLLAARPAFERVHEHFARYSLTQLQGCLAYGLSVEGFDRLVIGVTREAELEEILSAVASLPRDLPDFSPLAIADEDILNPAKWKK